MMMMIIIIIDVVLLCFYSNNSLIVGITNNIKNKTQKQYAKQKKNNLTIWRRMKKQYNTAQ